MKLMTKEILERIPPLYEQEDKGSDAVVHVKFFTPDSSWTWYGTEYDPEEGRFFGKVYSNLCPEGEYGYFMLGELESATGPMGLPIERDMYFHPTPIGEVEKQHAIETGGVR